MSIDPYLLIEITLLKYFNSTIATPAIENNIISQETHITKKIDEEKTKRRTNYFPGNNFTY